MALAICRICSIAFCLTGSSCPTASPPNRRIAKIAERLRNPATAFFSMVAESYHGVRLLEVARQPVAKGAW